ncbi:MAG: 3'-5' exonuclease [Microbacteriaceae bacterium]|nr:3'-5' exonuclease [Microbacteriaceae bacterium]
MDADAEIPQWVNNIAVFDTETTGIDTRQSRIVTASIATLNKSGEVTSKQQWLVNPGIPIPPQATAVHGITDEIALRNGADAKTSVTEIINSLQGLFSAGIPVVVYNAPYDLSLLRYEALRHDLDPITNPKPVIDPLVIDKQVDRYRKGKRTLEITAAHYGIPLGEDAHESLADAVAAGRIAQAIANKFAGQLPVTVQELHDAQIHWAAAQEENFQMWLKSQGKEPSFKQNRTWPL